MNYSVGDYVIGRLLWGEGDAISCKIVKLDAGISRDAFIVETPDGSEEIMLLQSVISRDKVKTSDDFPMSVGDEVWIRPSVLYTKEEPKKVVVGKINESTIHFTEPDIEGYIGARMKSVFHKKENAYWSVDALRATGVFTESELVELL